MNRWDRLPGESARAYACFARYRDAGPSRSLAAAYRQETGKKQAGNPTGQWTGWYAAHDWKDRATAYDAHLELQARQEREAEHLREIEAFRDRQRRMATDTLESTLLLLERANERLDALDPADISAAALPSYFRAAVSIAAAATDAEASALAVTELLALLETDRAPDYQTPN